MVAADYISEIRKCNRQAPTTWEVTPAAACRVRDGEAACAAGEEVAALVMLDIQVRCD
jgi:hypothetical protein